MELLERLRLRLPRDDCREPIGREARLDLARPVQMKSGHFDRRGEGRFWVAGDLRRVEERIGTAIDVDLRTVAPHVIDASITGITGIDGVITTAPERECEDREDGSKSKASEPRAHDPII